VAALDRLQFTDFRRRRRKRTTRTRVARLKAPSLVLKPQREGGGNSIYREAIPAFLDSLRVEEREM